MKTVVLGMGNTILSDDGVGIYVVREVQRILQHDDVDVKETQLAGFSLLDLLAGYDKAVVVDAIRTKEGKIGDIYRLTLDSLDATSHMVSPHHLDFASTLDLGRKLDIDVPNEIVILAVEVCNTETFSESCATKEVKEAIPKVAKMVMNEL